MSSMPTHPQRPFFSSFLAAFRHAQSALPSQATKTPSSQSSQSAPTSPPPSHPRTIATKSGPTTSALTALSPRTTSTSPLSRSPGTSPGAYGPLSRADASAAAAARNISAANASSGLGGGRRRGSDSSTEGGFRDVLGGEKWYIGGRTAAGEERFFKLGVVRRERSLDRLSADRLSL